MSRFDKNDEVVSLDKYLNLKEMVTDCVEERKRYSGKINALERENEILKNKIENVVNDLEFLVLKIDNHLNEYKKRIKDGELTERDYKLAKYYLNTIIHYKTEICLLNDKPIKEELIAYKDFFKQ